MVLPISLKGSQFAVTSATTPTGLSIAALANGEVAVAWQDGANAVGQLFNADGTAASSEFVAAASGGGGETLTNENVVALADGNFVETWNDNVIIGGQTFVTVDAQMYDPNLNKIGGQITVIPQFQQSPFPFTGADVFATPDGGFAYAESVKQFEYVQAFNANETKNGTEHQTGSQFPFLFAATALTNGNIVTLNGNFDSYWVYTAAGAVVGGQMLFDGGTATQGDVAALPNGQFVITYGNFVSGGNAVFAQIYNSDGTPFGSRISVNDGAANTGGNIYPHVATLTDGRFVVSWYDTSGDANNNLTEVRVFNASGTPATGVFAIPGSSEAGAFANDVTALSDVSFAVDWNTGSGIHGQVLTVPESPNGPTNPDFNGDGKADILWQKDDGHVWQWLMNASQVVGSNDLGNGGNPAWHVVATGDFNGDGKSDLLWQNDDGHVWETQLNGNQVVNSLDLGNAGNPAWHVVTTGDFNGDGKSDILWQNDDGHVWESQMNGGQVINSLDLGNAGNPFWHVVATGDFNGDGKSDLLWQADDGHVWISEMNGGTVINSIDEGNAGNSAWHVVTTGDFNGDGKSDILWQNDDGHVWISMMNGGTVIDSIDEGNAGNPAWHVVRTGDYNGDGKSDILWQKDDGHVWQSLMNGGQVIGSNDLGNAGDPAWHILAAHA
ncbi:MAG: FG-GAP repeat domain-containing protein [Hyphomicrobiales bacterium]